MAKWKLKDLFWVSDATEKAAEKEPLAAPSSGGERVSSLPTVSAQIERVLSMLRDVDGVVGSLAVANAGDLLGSDLPRMFDGAALDALAMRLSQLRVALGSAGDPMKTAEFRYQSHVLYLSQLDCGLLGILAELRTHEPALEMASKLVGKRLEAAVSAATP